jgi:small-conductance mechanosensitive channel
LIPYQFSSDVFRTVIPYVVLLALIAILLFVARRVAPLTGKLIEILRTRLNLSEGVADLLSALVRFAIWFVAAMVVVAATLVTFGLGQVIAESIVFSLTTNASRIAIVVLTLVISYILVRLIRVFLTEFRTRTKLHPFTVNLLENVATYFIYAIAALLILTNVLVAAGLATIAGSLVTLFAVLIGLVVSFAATGSIGNALAGLVLMSWRPYREGDRVEIGTGTYGDILEIDVMFTKVRTIKDEIVYVPNLHVLSNRIMNYNGLERCIVHQQVTIGYDVKRTTVEELLSRAAEKTEGLLHDPPSFVLITNLDNYYVAYQINAYTKRQNELVRIYSDLMKNILDVFDEAGVEILSPQYAVLRLGKNVEGQTSSRGSRSIPSGS